ncbi:GNAT family N-acetyltransferase [Oricola thermophila]|uniref:GNAT family N-acetyltransferase n=1 Tax=Oricola thermophila TaxID=2742145 RepID=A0A6N1VEE8_9HYPH|nr:GNAT family N-acetyltransferase [Oricola thermophila]QKV17975.1 GNAT family N-acetyltransferase [Oricola thermophila]
MAKLDVVPLTVDRWRDFERLFGRQGACYGCWCTYFRLAPKQRKANSSEDNKAFMRARIETGPPPGLLGYSDGEPVVWMQIGPRADIPEFNNPGRVSAPLPDGPADAAEIWAISCFFARRDLRGQGLSHQLVAAGIDHARRNGARLLEACPMDRSKQAQSVGLFVGSTSVFLKAGFEQVALRKAGRPLMRCVL